MRTAGGGYEIELWGGPHDGAVVPWPELPVMIARQHAVLGLGVGVARYEREGPDLPRRDRANRYVYAGWEDA